MAHKTVVRPATNVTVLCRCDVCGEERELHFWTDLRLIAPEVWMHVCPDPSHPMHRSAG